MLLTAAFHTIGIFVQPEPQNETERQLKELMESYRLDAGGGFRPSMSELVTALSSCFSLLYLFGAWVNCVLLMKADPQGPSRGILTANLVIFGICFAIMAYFTFLPPIVMTGLVFLCLAAAAILRRTDSLADDRPET